MSPAESPVAEMHDLLRPPVFDLANYDLAAIVSNSPGVGLQVYEDYRIVRFHTDIAQLSLPASGLPVGASPRTIGALIRSSLVQPDATIVQYGESEPRRLCAIAFSPAHTFFCWGYQQDVIAESPVPRDVWVHVLMTYDGSNSTIFVNGKAEKTAAVELDTLATNIRLGGQGFRGEIAEVKIWDRALSVQEIAQVVQKAMRPAFRTPADQL